VSKTNVFLAALLVLQLAALGVRAARGGGSGDAAARAGVPAEGKPLLPGIEAAKVAKIEVKDNQAKEVVLARSGDGWIVASAADYPAKPDAVQRILDKLLAIRSVGVTATNPKSHAGLEVGASNAIREVRLLDADGKELAHLYLGHPMAGGSLVRLAGSDDVHRTSESITYEASTAPATYVDTQLLSAEEVAVKAVSIARAGHPELTIERAEGDKWKITRPAAVPAAKDKAEEVVRNAARVWFNRPVAKEAALEHGLTPPAIVVTATLQDGKTQVLEIGAKTPEGTGRFARKGGEKMVVEIAEHTADAFEKEIEALTEPPPGAPSGGGAPAPGAPPGLPGGMPAPGGPRK
jgi:hypothetical protein